MFKRFHLSPYKFLSFLLTMFIIFSLSGCSSAQPGTKPILTTEDAIENEQLYRLKAPYTQVW